jgi:hypothetical protein
VSFCLRNEFGLCFARGEKVATMQGPSHVMFAQITYYQDLLSERDCTQVTLSARGEFSGSVDRMTCCTGAIWSIVQNPRLGSQGYQTSLALIACHSF